MWLLSIAQMLTVAATGAQPVAAGLTAENLPEPIPTRQTYFAIPFEIDQVDHPTFGAAEIQLFVSRDRGGTWQHETSVAPTTKHFLFRAAGDGEYWFAVRTKDRSGNFRPPTIAGPGLCVVVDTQAPTLSIEAQRGQAGQIIAKWKIDEAQIKPESFKLLYRMAGSQQWEAVAVDPAEFKTDGRTNSGEATWWAPAGQGRVEIRVEVADAAGNPNVSHAQVTTVASVAPPNATAQTTQNAAPSATYQSDWQPSTGQPGQDSWSQQGNSTRQVPQQGSSAYDPYQQAKSAPRANDPVPNANYAPGANSSYSTGSNPSEYNPRSSGSHGGGYGVDAHMTAQQSQSSSIPPSRRAETQYAQDPQSPTQQPIDSYRSPSGYGQPSPTETNRPWSEGSSYGANNSPGIGTIAAQPAPAYQSQYTPNGRTSQTTDRQTTNRYGATSDYGSSNPRNAAQAVPERTVNCKLFEIDYTDPPQPMTVGRVELWGTRDGGASWQSFGFDSDSRSPMLARVPGEGTYGFKVVFHPMYGQPAQAPRRGQSPDMIIRVDLTRPDTRLIGVDQPAHQPGELTIRWQAFDTHFSDTPISLYYADASTAQWLPIAKDLSNSGTYHWNLPLGLPPEVQIRVEAKDAAGNIATAETRTPVRVAAIPGPASGARPYSVEIQNARPMGPSDKSSPRRYYIR